MKKKEKNNMATYYFLIGIPGSGKSTWARELAARTGAVVICPDDIRVNHRIGSERAFEIAREEIAVKLQSGRDVIFDATNTIRKWREKNILAGRTFATRVVAVVFETPLELCLDRQRQRVAQGGLELENAIIRMADQLKNNPLLLEEGFDEIRYISSEKGGES
jgi:predicted kinase